MSDIKQPDTSRRLISINEACHALSAGRNSIYYLINEHMIDTVRLGRRRLVVVASLDRFIAKAGK